MPPAVRFAALAVCAAVLMAGGAAAFAQAAPAANPLDQLPLPPSDRSPGGGAQVQVAPAPQAPAPVLAQSVTPTRFDVQGVQSVPFADVAALFAPLVGRAITVGDLVEKAREATALYDRAGWGLSFVYIPTQSFAGGVVRVVAVEGHVAQVRIEGDAGRSRERLEAIAAQIAAEKPLSRRTFERYSALLGRLPGLTVDARVPLPASTDGASTMTLAVTREPFDASVGADLRRPQPRAVGTVTLSDVITPGGELSASALLFGRDERLRSVQYRQAVGVEGWMLKAALTSYRGDPDAVLGLDNAFERRNTNLRRELSALYPLRLAAQSALFVSGGVYSVDNVDTTRNPANGAFLSDIARVRAGFAQVEWQQDDGRVGRTGQVMLAHGFDAAGAASAYASNVAGLAGPNPARIDFTRVAAQAREARRFANDWGAAVSAGVQWSPHPLPATERMSFGGSRFARGYPAGETSGDQGWGVGFEVHRSFAVASTRVKQVQPYLLLEAARAYGHLATPAPARLSSVSAGVRVADLAHYAVDVSISRATGDRPLENPERRPRLALQFSWRL